MMSAFKNHPPENQQQHFINQELEKQLNTHGAVHYPTPLAPPPRPSPLPHPKIISNFFLVEIFLQVKDPETDPIADNWQIFAKVNGLDSRSLPEIFITHRVDEFFPPKIFVTKNMEANKYFFLVKFTLNPFVISKYKTCKK
jgi:hypothetical protein